MGYYNDLSLGDTDGELFSDEGWHVDDRRPARNLPQPIASSTVALNPGRGCREVEITVFSDSTAELVVHNPEDSANTWSSLLVDGRYYRLVMTKFTHGRPELVAALNQALALVQAAIDSLQLATPAAPALSSAPQAPEVIEPLASSSHHGAGQAGATADATPPAASALSRIDTFISQALEEFVTDTANLLHAAEATRPRDADVKDEIRFWKAQRNAFVKALHYFGQGVRLAAHAGGYTVPSASRPGALIHRLHRAGGVWLCSCEAGQRGLFHWHAAMVAGTERGHELADLDDRAEETESPPPPPPPPPFILVEHTPGGLALSRGDAIELVTTPAEVARAIGRLASPAARMGQRLALARNAPQYL